jgi:hypothetical protein
MAKKKAARKPASGDSKLLLSINIFTPEPPDYPNRVRVGGSALAKARADKTLCPTGVICVRGEAFDDSRVLQEAAAITYQKGSVPGTLPTTPPAKAKKVPAGPNNTFNFVADADLVRAACKAASPYIANTLVVYVRFGANWEPTPGLFDFRGMCSDRTECGPPNETPYPAEIRSTGGGSKAAPKKAAKKKTPKKKA